MLHSSEGPVSHPKRHHTPSPNAINDDRSVPLRPIEFQTPIPAALDLPEGLLAGRPEKDLHTWYEPGRGAVRRKHDNLPIVDDFKSFLDCQRLLQLRA